MFFNFFIATLCFALPSLKFYANAAALKRDVFDPQITYPSAGVVWHVGEIHNVTWDTSILPPNFNQTGMIVLGFLNNTENDGNEHLDLNNPLATGFQLAAGKVNVTVPAVTPMDSYILILFGDSGNASPEFTITNLSIGTTSSPSSAIPSTPVSEPSTSISSLNDGSSSTIIATSTPESEQSSSQLASSSNPAAANNNSPVTPSGSSTMAFVVSNSPVSTASSTSPSSSSTSPPASTAADNSTNGTTQTNSAAQGKTISFTVLSLSATTAVLLLWGW